MTAVLGDFLRPAAEHTSFTACFRDDLPDTAVSGAIRELSRMISTLTDQLGEDVLGHRPVHGEAVVGQFGAK
jgi:hypothetical protein